MDVVVVCWVGVDGVWELDGFELSWKGIWKRICVEAVEIEVGIGWEGMVVSITSLWGDVLDAWIMWSVEMRFWLWFIITRSHVKLSVITNRLGGYERTYTRWGLNFKAFFERVGGVYCTGDEFNLCNFRSFPNSLWRTLVIRDRNLR